MKITKNDVFERKYVAKFRHLAAIFGEFVLYERDKGSRDIGIHLTRKTSDGSETVSSTLCWFQLKGISAGSLAEKRNRDSSTTKIQIYTKHLRFWYVQPMPTYLAVYLESDDCFVVTDIKKYIERAWGRNIFTLSQESVTVEISNQSVLDKTAFGHILARGDVDSLVRLCKAKESEATTALRDCNFIASLALPTAEMLNIA